MIFQTRSLSSLSKVFGKAELEDKPYRKGTALRGENFSFQIAYKSEKFLKNIVLSCSSQLNKYTEIREVKLRPATYLSCEFDENVLSKEPGLFPDFLFPCNGSLKAVNNSWRSVWFTVRLPENVCPGKYKFDITFDRKSDKENDTEFVVKESFELEILDCVLPEQKLIHTEWFHVDCIALLHDVEIWSELHWKLLYEYMKNAADHGVNMLLTPIFTPPVDTQVGHERPTVQLLDIVLKNGKYSFGFDKLERWLDMAAKCGIKYFEMPHFFTQWGAQKTPKIIAVKNGEKCRIFGWDVEAESTEYNNFLEALLSCLCDFLAQKGVLKNVYFHVSDEPEEKDQKQYSTASSLLRKHLNEHKIIDCLSDISFYERGLVEIPVPSIGEIEPFMKTNLKERWCYYCCGPSTKTTNRFLHFPSQRTRILGMQLYKYGMDGFLHWGYNFWFKQYSMGKINPFEDCTAGENFPAGDPFVVYPGNTGPLDSLRWEVLFEAMQDLRALQLLEKLIGRKATIALLEKGIDSITMTDYPKSLQWLLDCRENINHKIQASIFEETYALN